MTALLPLASAGCRSYAPEPPDLEAHHAAWLERSPTSGEVLAFAETLRRAPAPPAASDPAGRLTASDAEVVALVFNADLRAARARAGVTRATRDHAGRWSDPVLSVIPERLLSGGPHPWSVAASIGLTLPVSGRLAIERRRADAAHLATLLAVVELEWQIRMDVRRAWIAWSAAAIALHETRDFLDRFEEITRLVARMEDVGELAPMLGRPFRIEHARRRNALLALEAVVEERALALRRVLGLAPSAPLAAVPEVAFTVVTPGALDAAARIRAHHPRLRTLLAAHSAAERTLELAVRGQYPDLVIGPGYSRDDGADHVMLGLSLPIPIFHRNRQQIAEALAARAEAAVLVETTYEALLHDHALAGIRLASVDAQRARVIETILPLVERQSMDARRSAELGEVDTLLLLDTLSRSLDARLDLVDLEARRSHEAIRMAELLGPPEIDAVEGADHE